MGRRRHPAPSLWRFRGAGGTVAVEPRGWLSDRLSRRIGERTARQAPLVAGLLASAACSAAAALSSSAALALAAISAALFCANVATTAGWALVTGLALVATVEAMANTAERRC